MKSTFHAGNALLSRPYEGKVFIISDFFNPFSETPSEPRYRDNSCADMRAGGVPLIGYVAPNSIPQMGKDGSSSSLGSLFRRLCQASMYLIAAGVSLRAPGGLLSSTFL